MLFAAGVAGGLTHGPWQDLFNHWVYTAAMTMAFGCVAWRAVVIRAERGAWLAIAAGLGCFLLGDLYFNGFLAALEEPPYPSWADAGWLALLSHGLRRAGVVDSRPAGAPACQRLAGGRDRSPGARVGGRGCRLRSVGGQYGGCVLDDRHQSRLSGRRRAVAGLRVRRGGAAGVARGASVDLPRRGACEHGAG